jgi:hypothetical protein
MMDVQVFFLLMNSIVLLVDLMQETFIKPHLMNSTFFECDDSMNVQQALKSTYMCCYLSLYVDIELYALSFLFNDLGH